MWTFVAAMLLSGLLEAAISSPQSASRAGGAIGLASDLLARIVDPSLPLVPDRSTSSAPSSSASSSSTTALRVIGPGQL